MKIDSYKTSKLLLDEVLDLTSPQTENLGLHIVDESECLLGSSLTCVVVENSVSYTIQPNSDISGWVKVSLRRGEVELMHWHKHLVLREGRDCVIELSF